MLFTAPQISVSIQIDFPKVFKISIIRWNFSKLLCDIFDPLAPPAEQHENDQYWSKQAVKVSQLHVGFADQTLLLLVGW